MTGSSYAGTSNLFAAYIAGAVVNWWDALVLRCGVREEMTVAGSENTQEQIVSPGTHSAVPLTASRDTNNRTSEGADNLATRESHSSADGVDSTSNSQSEAGQTSLSGLAIYTRYYAPAVNSILKPFFFVCPSFSYCRYTSLTRPRHQSASQSQSRECTTAPSSGVESCTQSS